MHEFSLALEVISLARREANKNRANSIQEITIEIGDLSGVETDAFESALSLLVRDSVLDQARITLVRTPGEGKCNACDFKFKMNHRMATCPKCQCFPSEINGGDEFRVVSLVVE